MHQIGDWVNVQRPSIDTLLGVVEEIHVNPATKLTTFTVKIEEEYIECSEEELTPYRHAHITSGFSRRAINEARYANTEDG